jgi:hypothetical protein
MINESYNKNKNNFPIHIIRNYMKHTICSPKYTSLLDFCMHPYTIYASTQHNTHELHTPHIN